MLGPWGHRAPASDRPGPATASGHGAPIRRPPLTGRFCGQAGDGLAAPEQIAADLTHYHEGAARVRLGEGFFRPDSRPARDLGVWLVRSLVAEEPPQILDVMAGCGIRSLRYGLEGAAGGVWANDADPDRQSCLKQNLEGLPDGVRQRVSTLSAQQLLARCLLRRERFHLVDLDAFGCPTALLSPALEAVRFEGILYLASTDGRSPTGHDRTAAVRRWGSSARAHPASWELALRLQLGALARSAWAMGRGIDPVLSFSDGRTFRTAVRVRRRPASGEEDRLGMLAHCHGCGDQQVQSLLRLGRWQPCWCGTTSATPLSVSGPLWIGPLQDSRLFALPPPGPQLALGKGTEKLLARLNADSGWTARCWPMAEIARHLGAGPPRLDDLVTSLRRAGHGAAPSGVMAAQVRTDAPWSEVLARASELVS